MISKLHGQEFQHDPEDTDLLSMHYYRNNNRNAYMHRVTDKKETIYMHRDVMERKHGSPLPRELVVHHIDENRRNNTRSNLDLCTRQENMMATPPRNGRFKGVYKRKNSYVAKCGTKHLGTFKNEIDAARAYNSVASTVRYAYLNPVE